MYPRNTSAQVRSVSSVEAAGRNRRGVYDANSVIPRKGPNYFAQRFGGNDFVAPDVGHDDGSSRSAASSTSPTGAFESDYHAQSSKKLSMHTLECIEQMTQACDKLLGARQLIESDNSISEGDKEKLLTTVYKSINQFRVRLENALPEGRTFSDMTNVSNATKTQMPSTRPSNLSATSVDARGVTNTSIQADPDQLDADFIARNGPRLMQLLESMSARRS
jgi:hypothetical protein